MQTQTLSPEEDVTSNSTTIGSEKMKEAERLKLIEEKKKKMTTAIFQGSFNSRYFDDLLSNFMDLDPSRECINEFCANMVTTAVTSQKSIFFVEDLTKLFAFVLSVDEELLKKAAEKGEEILQQKKSSVAA